MVTTTSSGSPQPRVPSPQDGTDGVVGLQKGQPATGRAHPPRLYTLDGLRFAAAVGVLLHHFTARWHTGWGEDPGERFPVLGHVSTYFALAPELFFVISGFVILWTAWGRSVPAVVASRLSRLYPSYWAALLMTSFLLLVIWPEGKRITIGEVLVNLTLMQSAFNVRHVDGVYWTLWTELRFYLLIVLLVAIGLTRRRIIWFCALWPLAAWAVDVAGWQYAQMFLISTYAPLFAGGMLLFLIFRDGHSTLLWSLVAGNVALSVHHIVPVQMRSLEANTIFAINPWLVGALVVGCFGLVVLLSLTRIARLKVQWFVGLGAITYPLYLIHEFWGWWIIAELAPHAPTYVTLAAAMAFSVVLALIIHHGVEKTVNTPVRRWLERVLSRRPAQGRQGSPPTSPAGTSPASRSANS
ncbi:acyltransferase family protein [Cellulomonas bogoriensis]|uniref:Acyltransferase n=1 Tax=Cellulomonas bogoriensis 69B4 = DSM 16987 TaxID=1386082 RepID=A0A0A0C1N4_9CELL|nr:acyltransferase [Cellulomonas bogoriensis]KGM13259.1 acyltransferase [Cellulomonas bogoriensis 69B4 = DSM 16987]